MQFVCVPSENTLANKGLLTFICILSRRDITFCFPFVLHKQCIDLVPAGVTSPTTVQEHETLFCLWENDTRGNSENCFRSLSRLQPQKCTVNACSRNHAVRYDCCTDQRSQQANDVNEGEWPNKSILTVTNNTALLVTTELYPLQLQIKKNEESTYLVTICNTCFLYGSLS